MSGVDELLDGDDAKSVVNLGRTGVYLSAIEGDVRTLMRTFQRQQTFDFATFREIWKEQNFSLVHFVATEKNSRQNFMRAAYRVVLEHLRGSALLEIRVGVVYALYLLYFTQPVNFPNIGVRVTMDVWAQLTRLHEESRAAELRDVVYVFDRLAREGAFELVAWVDAGEGVLRLDGDADGLGGRVGARLAQIEHAVMGSAQGGLGDPVTSKRQAELSAQYRARKRQLVGTRLIEQATRDFYAAEFGAPQHDLPGAVPLDISAQDEAWAAHLLARVREYQRVRADRVVGVAADDGSLRVRADFGLAQPRGFAGADEGSSSIGAIQRAEDNRSRKRHERLAQ